MRKPCSNLNDVIGEVLRLLGGETAKRHVAVETDLGLSLIHISATPTGDAVSLQIAINGVTTSDKVTIAVAP